MTDLTVPRDHLVRALRADLVGPYQLDEAAVTEQELLELPPSRHYLTGFLAPEGEREPDEVTEDDDLGAGPDEPEEENQAAGVEEPRRRNGLPASMGLSVLLPAAAKTVTAKVSFAASAISSSSSRSSSKSRVSSVS